MPSVLSSITTVSSLLTRIYSTAFSRVALCGMSGVQALASPFDGLLQAVFKKLPRGISIYTSFAEAKIRVFTRTGQVVDRLFSCLRLADVCCFVPLSEETECHFPLKS